MIRHGSVVLAARLPSQAMQYLIKLRSWSGDMDHRQ